MNGVSTGITYNAGMLRPVTLSLSVGFKSSTFLKSVFLESMRINELQFSLNSA